MTLFDRASRWTGAKEFLDKPGAILYAGGLSFYFPPRWVLREEWSMTSDASVLLMKSSIGLTGPLVAPVSQTLVVSLSVAKPAVNSSEYETYRLFESALTALRASASLLSNAAVPLALKAAGYIGLSEYLPFALVTGHSISYDARTERRRLSFSLTGLESAL